MAANFEVRMPDWAQELLRNHPWAAAALGVAVTCYKVFGFVEDRLSANAKHEISGWLQSARDFAARQTLSFNLSRFHSQLFGDKQTSLKCCKKVFLFSLISFLLIFLPAIIQTTFSILTHNHIPISVGHQTFYIGSLGAAMCVIAFYLLMFALFVFPLDFLGVSITRSLATIPKTMLA
jgi:hypothetical protein